ncbi:MAG TPA: hypothetical protein VNG12_15800 [Acidimicrobiales bacterium]|nr:hypothetical protein [Acidimicrobiales bacterium]
MDDVSAQWDEVQVGMAGAQPVAGGFRAIETFSVEGEPLTLGNEFAEVLVRKVRTRNGLRLEICSPKLGFAVRLCPLQLEALTWQSSDVFSGFLSNPLGPVSDAPEP